MPSPWIRRLSGLVIAIAIAAAVLALPWALSSPWVRSQLPQQWNTWTLVALAADAALLLLVAIWWLWWRLPRRQLHKLDVQIHDPKARADTEDNFRKTVGQALGGAAVLIGAAAAYLQFTQQQQATRDQLKASHDLLISNQVSKGFEQFASDKMTMRLGGIYALEGVMNTSEQYHQPVLEALCAFVREGTSNKPSNKAGGKGEQPTEQPGGTHKPATDIQAALAAIGRRSEGGGDVNLAGAHISGALLSDADLGGANLSSADLSSVVLTNANLSAAVLNRANLSGADLSWVGLNSADLRLANLSSADLSDADLSFAILSGANLKSAILNRANLTGADLSDASSLTQEQLDQACGKPRALPPGLTLDKPKPCPSK